MSQQRLFPSDADTIPALTICQPWAWAILRGHKTVENRTWATRYTGPLVIHAGASKAWLRDGEAFLQRHGFFVRREWLIFGALLGVVELVDCGPVSQHAGNPWAFGPICWELAKPRPLAKPVPYKGQLGIFRVPRSLVAACLAA